MNWYKKAQDYYSPEDINRNIDEFMETQQQTNPETGDFAIDFRDKPIAIKADIRKAINNKIHDLADILPIR